MNRTLVHRQISQRHVAFNAVRVWPHVLIACFAFGWAIAFDVGVRVYLAELVALGLICFVAPFKTLKRFPIARSILAAYFVWIVAIVLSDTLNDTPIFDMARSVATPVLGGFSLVFVLSVISQNPNALLTFVAVTAISKAVLGDPAYGDQFAEYDFSWASVEANTNYFKVRFAPALTPAIVLLAYLAARRSFLLAAIVCFSASVLYFLVDARSGGLIFFLASLSLVAIQFRFRPKLDAVLVASVLAIPVMYMAYVAYVDYTLKNGGTGNSAVQLSLLENPYNPLGLLLQGRSELTISADAISERPLLGHGSWARDTDLKFSTLRQERTVGDAYLPIIPNEEQFIPVHSTFVAMWLWSGIVGAFAGCMLIFNMSRLSAELFSHRSPLLAAGLIYAFSLWWDLLFSPPQVVRLSVPVAIALLTVLDRMNRKKD